MRKFFGWALAAITVMGSMQAFAGDREIAEQIMTRLKTNRDSGALKDFTLDMKVHDGVVLFRGSVSQQAQKDLVLAAADKIEGVANIVDEVKVLAKVQPTPKVVKQAKVTPNRSDFSLREALAKEASNSDVAPGEVRTTAAVEVAQPSSSDQTIVNSVVGSLGRAQNSGKLRGFGVKVKCHNGIVELKGQASSQTQRDQIVSIASNTPGVRSVHDTITIPAPNAAQAPIPGGRSIQARPASSRMSPVAVSPVNRPVRGSQLQAAPVSAPIGVPAMAADYTMGGSVVSGAPVMGQPVPMNYGGGIGAPRYDAPNLPNYAWPGYASHPNYAALSYPQQYSPSAWPYIGPFYPYPQVPLGWRKVSLEWDDGWWFLDFTDR